MSNIFNSKREYICKGATTGRIQTAKPNYIEGPRSENVVIMDYMTLLSKGTDVSKSSIHEFLEEVEQAYLKLPEEERKRIDGIIEHHKYMTNSELR